MAVTKTLTPIVNKPSTSNLDNFETEADGLFDNELPTLVDDLNVVISQINSTETNINTKEANSVASAQVAVAAANFKGTYTNQTTQVGESYLWNGVTYLVLVAGNTSPTTSPSNWKATGLSDQIHSATSKTTPVDADEFGIWDSVTSTLKKVSFANLKSTLFNATNIIFGGTAQRIQSDFSNSTISSRTAFQTSTANGATNFEVLPNGTANVSAFSLNSASDPTNASVLQQIINSTAAIIRSGIRGSGALLPLQFQIGTTTYAQIDTSGNFTINGVGVFGIGQTWQNMTPSRAATTVYTNTTGKPTLISISGGAGASSQIRFQVNGVTVASTTVNTGVGSALNLQCIVPAGATYASLDAFTTWFELR